MTATQPNYLSISRRALDVEDYLDLARRHIAWILGPVFAGLAIAIVVAFLLPNQYISRATMQITPAQVSEALVPATVTQRLTDRINQMQAGIMSRTSLSALIQSPNLALYKDELARSTMEDVIEQMRRSLVISIRSISGSGGRQASSFDISFTYRNKIKARDTVQALITRFSEENNTVQRNTQTQLKNLFGDEVTQAKANLQKAQEALTQFRVVNAGRLPEQVAGNIASMNGLQQQYQSASDQIYRLDASRTQIESVVASIRSQMEAARVVLANAAQESASVNPASPAARQNAELAGMNRSIYNAEFQLDQVLQNLKESHPDVKNLRKQIALLKTKRDAVQEQQDKDQAEERTAALNAAQSKEPAPKRADPRVLAIMADFNRKIEDQNLALKSNDSERNFQLKQRERLEKEIAGYRDRLAPNGADAQYQDLLRDLNNATESYQQALGRQKLTAQSGEVVQRGAGELLEVIDPPSVPASHSKPNRWLIVGAGFAISIIVGLAMAGLQEAKDTSLKNLKDVRAYTNLPVLGSIPLLENTMLVKRKRRIGYLLWSGAVIIGVVAVCASVFYYYSVTANS